MPGTLVTDALAAELHDGTAVTADGAGSGGWVQVEFPMTVGVQAVCATCTGTGEVFGKVEAADDASATNAVVVGAIGPFGDGSDNATYLAPMFIDQKYVRIVFEAEGTTSVTPTVKLVEPNLGRLKGSTTAGVTG